MNRSVADAIAADPILGQISGMQLSNLLPHVTEIHLAPGQPLYQAGQPADAVYVILSGDIRLERKDGHAVQRSAGYAGQESLFGIGAHSESAKAVSDAVVLRVPAGLVGKLAERSTAIRDRLFQTYVARYAEDAPAGTASAPKKKATAGRGDAWSLLGWMLCIVLPVLIYFTGPAVGLSHGATDFLAIIVVTVCMWLFGLVPEYVPPLFSALAVILLDVAPPELALSGFRSESFFMCLSVFGIGTLMVTSGLTYRFSLWILGKVPATPLGYNLSLFGIGAVLSPIIPSVVGRVSIISPFLMELIGISKAGSKDLYASRLIYSLTTGAAIFVPLFLTASVPNLVVYGLFDSQTQFAFDWLSWLYAASVFGVFVLIAFFVVSACLFRGGRNFSVPRETILEQRRVLGPLSVLEWTALVSVLAMIIGIVSETQHRVDVPWIALSIFVTLLLLGTLHRDDMRASIDWPILVYIGAIVGWVPIAKRTGLDTVIVENLKWLGVYMDTNLPLFILLVSCVILVVRLALPTGVTVVLFVTALFPLASANGVSLWLIGFIILAVADTFIFPYQSSYYLKLRNDLEARGMADVCDERRIVFANVIMIALRVAAIFGCLSFWKYLDLI